MTRSNRRCAFTLIELLVVVSIIALLISILLPSLRRAKEQAKVAVCIAGLKGLATASVVYAEDDNRSAIPVHPIIYEENVGPFRAHAACLLYGGKSGRGKWNLNPLWWGTAFGRGPAQRPMNASLFKSGLTNYSPPPYGNYQQGDSVERWTADTELKLDQFKCPSDTGYSGVHWTQWRQYNLPAYDYFGTSFEANGMWTTNGSRLAANGPFMRPMSRVPNPANTVYFRELCGKYAWQISPHPDNGCDYNAEDYRVIHGWHKRDYYFDVTFCDAHAETLKMRGYESPRLSEYPGYTDLQDGWTMYRCVTMRGQGYQMDTLPAPLVETDIADD